MKGRYWALLMTGAICTCSLKNKYDDYQLNQEYEIGKGPKLVCLEDCSLIEEEYSPLNVEGDQKTAAIAFCTRKETEVAREAIEQIYLKNPWLVANLETYLIEDLITFANDDKPLIYLESSEQR